MTLTEEPHPVHFTPIVNERDLRTAGFQAILGDIAAHFAEHDLTAGAVAERLGVSVNSIYLLLEETGRPFAEHLLERRLEHAWALLLDPRRLSKRLAQIAHQCGFSDLAYFNRTFRRRYGMTPAELRADTLSTMK